MISAGWLDCGVNAWWPEKEKYDHDYDENVNHLDDENDAVDKCW